MTKEPIPLSHYSKLERQDNLSSNSVLGFDFVSLKMVNGNNSLTKHFHTFPFLLSDKYKEKVAVIFRFTRLNV